MLLVERVHPRPVVEGRDTRRRAAAAAREWPAAVVPPSPEGRQRTPRSGLDAPRGHQHKRTHDRYSRRGRRR